MTAKGLRRGRLTAGSSLATGPASFGWRGFFLGADTGRRAPAKVAFGSGIRIQRAPDSGLECAAEPTFATVALLHLKRTAAISAVEGHLIERVNGRFGPQVSFAQTEPVLSRGTAANSNS
jgi:hypothetical protein